MPKKSASKHAKSESQDLTFEQALERLEAIVTQLETGDAPLDSALKLYEEGVRLSRFCSKQLKEAERRVEILEDVGNELKARSFLDKSKREELGLENVGEDEEEPDESEFENEEADEADDEEDEHDEDEVPRRRNSSQDTLF